MKREGAAVKNLDAIQRLATINKALRREMNLPVYAQFYASVNFHGFYQSVLSIYLPPSMHYPHPYGFHEWMHEATYKLLQRLQRNLPDIPINLLADHIIKDVVYELEIRQDWGWMPSEPSSYT